MLQFFGGVGVGVLLGAALMAYGLVSAAAAIVDQVSKLFEEQERRNEVEWLISTPYEDGDQWKRP